MDIETRAIVPEEIPRRAPRFCLTPLRQAQLDIRRPSSQGSREAIRHERLCMLLSADPKIRSIFRILSLIPGLFPDPMSVFPDRFSAILIASHPSKAGHRDPGQGSRGSSIAPGSSSLFAFELYDLALAAKCAKRTGQLRLFYVLTFFGSMSTCFFSVIHCCIVCIGED